jgi:tetratricopeptide (TPR) repeat protein
MKVVLFAVTAVRLPVAVASEESQSPARKLVQVAADAAQGFLGEQPVAKLDPGAVFVATHERNGWLFLPRKNAWVHQDAVINLADAEAHYARLLGDRPQPETFHHRGIARHYRGEYAAALTDYNESVQRGLNTSAVFLNRGNAAHALGQHRNALADYERALQLDAANALVHSNRALTWVALDNLERALEDCTHAIRLDPTFVEAYNNRGVIHRHRGQYQQAISDYTAAIERFPRFAEAHANRGFARKQLGDFRGALEDYYLAITIAPDEPQPYNDAAWLMATSSDESLRNGPRAVEYAGYACRKTGFREGDYVDTLAASFAEVGRFDDAVATQRQALTLLTDKQRPSAEQRLQSYLARKPWREATASSE